ncbi:CPBP family intramembrane metalloprotease, partial [Cutibacterium acnes]
SVNLPEKAGCWTSVVVSALVFAFMHGTQNAWLFADRFAFGLLAGWLVIVTGGLEAGVAAHVVNNLFAFGYAVFLGGVSQARGMTAMSWVDAAWDVGGFLTIALAGWWIGSLMRVARRTPA